ncbi:hypothetical protein Coch_0677 [Capnocytophaga ochracea DSM 7271]|jgi:hypothetical protein|uniref:Uncharacterized protein n=2 Tax=Capnocytophaga ochracea TaxID=1018 RepID=C7M7X9_CAPOD|nr:hypothetical protein [Capnocytophaga ochracea]ACU92235.1 hypothetical protein Coch_0677 [Capnocytophaga ochracea DSM 7271]UAK50990.1 hypothetical protein K8O87_09565 [Capnocytophaga ochracea]UZD36576.1 hypothetical protein OLG90_01420 [Capnocytophaga ochracea]UZD40045.1 hypothetical protein OL231_07585 [Capnocytophaga ochracea]
MAREIKPTPVLEGQDVIEFYKKLAGFRRSLAEKGITRESVRKNAMLLKSIFKDDRDNASR